MDWKMKLENKSCEDAFNVFHDGLMYALDECAPEKPVRKKQVSENHPWVTSGLKKCIKKQRELYKSYLEDSANIQKKRGLQEIQSLFTKSD